MDKLVKKFIEVRSMPTNIELKKPLHDSIYILEKSRELIDQIVVRNLDKLSKNIPWAPMHDMYKRNYEYCCGALSCFLVGQFPSSEVLCRTGIEGSVNLNFMSIGDSMGKQIGFFKNYFETERKQNRNWRKSVENSNYSYEEKQIHFKQISQKEASLNEYEDMLRQSLGIEKINYNANETKWPKIFDRFKEINDEIGYRTVYAALCSESHSDPEDILNQIMTRVIKGNDRLDEVVFLEQYHFSLMMITTAIRYHITASAMYLSKFHINMLFLKDLIIEISDLANYIATNELDSLKDIIINNN